MLILSAFDSMHVHPLRICLRRSTNTVLKPQTNGYRLSINATYHSKLETGFSEGIVPQNHLRNIITRISVL